MQRPHPPLWYGAPNPDAIAWAVPKAINVVSLGPADRARAIADRYRKDWHALGRDAAALPHIGITRHVVVADTDAQAERIAQAAYPRWRDAMDYLWRRDGVPFTLEAHLSDATSPACRRSATALPVRRQPCAIISRGSNARPASITCCARWCSAT